VNGLDGSLGATTAKIGGTVFQLINIHGDVSLLLPLDTSVAPTALDADEYGNSKVGQTQARYNWLGSQGSPTTSSVVCWSRESGCTTPQPGSSSLPTPWWGETPTPTVTPLTRSTAWTRTAATPFPWESPTFWASEPQSWSPISSFWLRVGCGQIGCSVSLSGPNVAIPNKNSNSAKKYKNTKYIGYMIHYKGKIWKYGISRVGTSRPASQISTCNRYYGTIGGCRYTVMRRMTGWLNARSWETAMILKYVARHRHCPPGQAKRVCV
jgi:hypothetical protein